MENVSTYFIFKAWTFIDRLVTLGVTQPYMFPLQLCVFVLFFQTDMWIHVFVGWLQLFYLLLYLIKTSTCFLSFFTTFF